MDAARSGIGIIEIVKRAVCCLLLLLSLQVLWAGAAVACQHEPDPTAVHLGHHSAANANTDLGDRSNGPGPGGDCAICHLSSIKFYGLVTIAAPPAHGPTRPDPDARIFVSHFPSGPERPNWIPSV